MSNYSVISRIACMASSAEMKHARMLGANWFEAYETAYRVLDEISEVIALADPTPVVGRFRTYGPRP